MSCEGAALPFQAYANYGIWLVDFGFECVSLCNLIILFFQLEQTLVDLIEMLKTFCIKKQMINIIDIFFTAFILVLFSLTNYLSSIVVKTRIKVVQNNESYLKIFFLEGT